MRRSSSLVGISSRRAASVARSGSASIGASCWIVEAEFTAEGADLGLDANHDGEVATVNQGIACVLERPEQGECFVQVVADLLRRLRRVGRHEPSLAAAAWLVAA